MGRQQGVKVPKGETVMSRSSQSLRIRQMVLLAILTAIVVVLQLTGAAIKLPGTTISLVLIPITLGAMIIGPWAGAFLGFVFGLVVLIACGVMGSDFFTATIFNLNPVGTSFICIVKSTAAGFLSGLVFKLLKKVNLVLATFAAAIVTPVVNTGLFILFGLIMSGTIDSFISTAALGVSSVYFLVVMCAGINFFLELGLNLILAPALNLLYHIAGKRFSR